jgi:hypothetical protein
VDGLADADDDPLRKLPLARQLSERHQMPRPVGCRRFPAQDVEIAVVRAYLVKGILWAVPLVKYLLDHVLAILKPKSNRPFVSRPSGVAVHF